MMLNSRVSIFCKSPFFMKSYSRMMVLDIYNVFVCVYVPEQEDSVSLFLSFYICILGGT
jgi:hypothetical protein